MFFIYVLKSLKERKFYVGKTDNIERRLQEHNAGYSAYTRRYIPWEIIYQETHASEHAAIVREKYLKSAAGRRWAKKYIGL